MISSGGKVSGAEIAWEEIWGVDAASFDGDQLVLAGQFGTFAFHRAQPGEGACLGRRAEAVE